MRRKQTLRKSVLSLCLAILFAIQTIPFQAVLYAQEATVTSTISEASEPDNATPTETASTESEATESETTDSRATELAPTEPAPAEPEVTDLETTESTPADPEATDSKKTETAPTEPGATDPGKPDPAPTEPEVTNPDTPEPAPTEPEPVEPRLESPEKEELVLEELVPPVLLPVPLAGGTDKTGVFKAANPSFNLEVTQGDPEVVISEGGNLNGRSNFTIKLTNVWVPTKGDRTISDGSDIIQKGDTVILNQAEYFSGVQMTATGSPSIMIGNQKIATVTFAADKITILFDGDDIFFGGGKKEVKIALSATAKAADQTPGTTVDASIFGHQYKLANPALTPAYSIVMKSNSNNNDNSWINSDHFREGYVEWRATVKAFDRDDNTILMPLDGKQFYSALATAGTYVEGSFKVDGVDATPDITSGALTYTFPSTSTLENPKHTAVVTFRTWIPKAKYYYEYNDTNSSYYQGVANSAKLQEAGGTTVDLATSNTHRVAFKPDWIQMRGKRVLTTENGTKYIRWTVEVNSTSQSNKIKQGLKNFKITAPLPEGLSFDSAEYKLWENNDWGSATAIIPGDSGVYSGAWSGDKTLDTRIQLVIKSKVDSGTTFRLNAKTNWDLDTPTDGIQNNDATCNVADFDELIIGEHAFTKGGAWVRDAATTRWTINLTLQYDVPEATVYDLLVYGGSRDVLNSLDANSKVTAAALTAIKANIDDKQLWQKYRAGTLTSSGASGEVITLTSGSVAVADLIKITGYQGGTAGTVTFESATTNADNLFRQDRAGGWSNRALFFDGDSYLARYDANVTARVRMLNKEMLYAAQPLDANGNAVKVHDWRRKSSAEMNYPAINSPRWYTGSNFSDDLIRYAYDQATRTVTFRLAINQAGFNTDKITQDGGNRVASEIKLVDTLPAGWEFVEYVPGKDYELLAGTSSNGVDGGDFLYVNAGAVIPPGNEKHVVSNFTKNGNVGTFTFSKLESTYVILVKARPTNEALQTYTLGDNKVTNTAEFSMKWGDTLKSATETHPVIVPMRSLGKTVKKPVSGVQEWTVNYTPPFTMKQGVYLQDTLGAGLQLRKNVDGSLSLAPSDLAVYKGKLKADGTLERDGAALNLEDANCEVKVSVEWGDTTKPTKLKFQMADPNRLYQLVYQTESKGMTAGATAGNKIELLGDSSLPAISAQSSTTLDSNDVSGNASDNGILYLKKVKPDGTALSGVKFELFNPDDTPAQNKDGSVIGEKTTGTDGKTSFIIQTPGLYQLKQTWIDETTWLPTTTVYWVRVIDAPGCPVTVDGKKVDANTPLVVPTPATGKLTISNTVGGNGGEPDKEFTFTITFTGEGKDGSYAYTKLDGTKGTIKSGDKFLLKHGQTFVLPRLLENLVYTVTETDYTPDGYTTNPANWTFTGTIAKNGNHKADFVNTRLLAGVLLIGNTVEGNGGDKEKEFVFTVNFTGEGAGEEYSYTKPDGTPGKLRSGNTIQLKHGETITVQGLPKNLIYTVTEADYSKDDYTTNPANRELTGSIVENKMAEARFVNTRELPGGLTLTANPRVVPGDGKTPSELTATLIDSDGKPVSGKEVTFTLDEDGTLIGKATTDVQGNAKIPYTPLKLVGITSKEHKITATVTSSTGAKSTDTTTVTTTPAAITGLLRDNTTGLVMPNEKVVIVSDTDPNERYEIYTDQDGAYFQPVPHGGSYTVTFNQTVTIGGTPISVPYTQKVIGDSNDIEGKVTPAEITAVGIVLFKQPNGQTSQLDSGFASNLRIYLRDASGNYVTDVPLQTNGTFSAEGLSEQVYTMEVRGTVAGQELTLTPPQQLNVKANGELNISQELVDPYGTVYDKVTGISAVIEGAEVTLYYADTPRNRAAGKTPGSKVTLPAIPGFEPNDNLSPSQKSDVNGKYAYMVFPDSDYYLVVTKAGYTTYTSPTISVGTDIVRHDIPMSKESPSSGGSGGGGSMIPPVDKTELQAKDTEIRDSMKLDTLKKPDYTTTSWQNLQDKLTQAKLVLDKPNVTQKEVDEALAKLKQAREELVKEPLGLGVETPPTKPETPTVDKKDLQKKEAEINGGIIADTLKKSEYTDASWAELQNKLYQANTVLTKEEVTQAEVNEALAELTKARTDLDRKAPATGVAKPSVPKTGDTSQRTIWATGLATSVFLLLMLLGLHFVGRNKQGLKIR